MFIYFVLRLLLLLSSTQVYLECNRIVRPTVCLNNVGALYTNFDTAHIDGDVIVNGDVFVDNQMVFTEVDCIGCPESCMCPEGPPGIQGSEGPVGQEGPVGLVGPIGPEGPAGSEEGSEGIPTSIAEHYLYAIRDSDASTSEQELLLDQDVVVELDIVTTDDWGMGSGNNFVVPATGIYQITNEVRVFVDPGNFNLANPVSFETFLKKGGTTIPSSVCSYLLNGANTYPNNVTLRCTYLVYLTEGDIIIFCVEITKNNSASDVVIEGGDGINAVLIAIYLGDTVDGT